MNRLLLLLLLINITPSYFTQLISEPVSFYENGNPMQIKYLNEDLKLVKYVFKDNNGNDVAEYNYNPLTGEKNGTFFSGDNKGSYEMGILSAENYTLIVGSQKFIFDKIKDGRIIGDMHCYTRNEIYGSSYDRSTSQLLSRANNQRINFYQSYGTGKYREDFKCTLHYNEKGDLDGQQELNEDYTLYFTDGKLMGYVQKNPTSTIARDSIFRENKLWKYDNRFFKNCGYAWLKDFQEFDEPWNYEIKITYEEEYKPHFFGSSKIKPSKGPNFYPPYHDPWLMDKEVDEFGQPFKPNLSLDDGVRAEKRTRINEYGIYIHNNIYPKYSEYDLELNLPNNYNLIKLFQKYGFHPKSKTNEDGNVIFPDLEKISKSINSKDCTLTEYFYKDSLGNYINPIIHHKELIKYLNSEEHKRFVTNSKNYQDTLDNLFAGAYGGTMVMNLNNIIIENSKWFEKLNKYYEILSKAISQSVDVKNRLIYENQKWGFWSEGGDGAWGYTNPGGDYGDIVYESYAITREPHRLARYMGSGSPVDELLNLIPNCDNIPDMYLDIDQYWKNIRKILKFHISGEITLINIEEAFIKANDDELIKSIELKIRKEAQKTIDEADEMYKNKEYINALNSYNKGCQLVPSICENYVKNRIDSLTKVEWKFSYDWQSYKSFLKEINSTNVPQINIDSINNFSGGIYNYFTNISEEKKGYQVFFKPIKLQKNALARGDSQRCLNEYKKLIDYLARFSFLNIKASTINHFGVILDIVFVEKPKIEFLNYELKELKEIYKSKKTYFIYFDFETLNSFFLMNINKEQLLNIQKDDLSKPVQDTKINSVGKKIEL